MSENKEIKPIVCFTPNNRHIIITIQKNTIIKEGTLDYRFPLPMEFVCSIPVELPDDAIGVAISIRENPDIFEPLKFQFGKAKELDPR
jgi:hypothetical protein